MNASRFTSDNHTPQRSVAEQRAYWDSRAASFAHACGKSSYTDGFMARLRLDETPDASVFDMGCGPGTLAIPLARQGHPVMACDISQAMLDQLSNQARREGLDVPTKQLAWEDDWQNSGITEKSFDVAIASRSIKKKRIPEMIAKLERVAREKVAITVPAGPVPHVDPRLLEALGREVPENRFDMEVVSLLAEQGKYPEVSYLHHQRGIHFVSREKLQSDLLDMAGPQPLSQDEQQQVLRYIDQHIVEDTATDQDGNPTNGFRLDYALTVVWGLIIWRPDATPIL